MSGGGVALLYATKILENVQTQNEDERRGVQIIQNALKVCFSLSSRSILLRFFNILIRWFLQAPSLAIFSNAGFDGVLIVGKLLEQDNFNMGFDAAKGLFLFTQVTDKAQSLIPFFQGRIMKLPLSISTATKLSLLAFCTRHELFVLIIFIFSILYFKT